MTLTNRVRTSGTLTAVLLAVGAAVPLSVILVATPPALAQPTSDIKAKTDEQVPIRRITLYRSGVGYFERTGNIDGNAEIQLRFNTEQINDILKSMVLLDLDGGKIESVSYGSKEPLERRLASFGVNIASNPSLPDLLGQLRGARIKVLVAGDQLSGTVLGVENRLTPPSKDVPAVQMPHVNLVTDTGLRSIAISDISSFEILDKELASELNKALSTLAEYRADRTKTVDLRFAGTGARRVVVGYVHETPVWKTSYRLVLPEKDAPSSEGNKGSVVMQGWAIVENTTDQDWNHCKLSLVSGRPVSFQMDLYEPLFTVRPTIPVPTIPGVLPKQYAGGMNLDFAEKADQEAGKAKDRAYARRAPGSPPAAAAPMAPGSRGEAMKSTTGLAVAESAADASGAFFGVSGDDMVNYAARAQAQATEIGEVFQYEVETPVTVERQRSAMIPILSTNITGRRVSIYSLADARPNPMRGVEIVNESSLQLLPGPIAVFDGPAYAGDAQIGHIAKGDKRLLAYSVDLDVNVITKPQSNSTVTKLKIVDGMIVQTIATSNSVSYAFDNKDSKRARTVILEQPRLEGWTLTEPKKPLEQTQDIYRFEVPIEAGKTATMSVVQERTEMQSTGITSMDMPTLLSFHKNGKLSDAVLAAVRDVGKRQSDINTAERDIAELDRQKTEIDAEQSRIRENMAKIDRNSQLYTRYMTKLSDQENTLETLRDQRKAANTKLESLRNELNNFLRTLNVE
jgi:hypothetical protein